MTITISILIYYSDILNYLHYLLALPYRQLLKQGLELSDSIALLKSCDYPIYYIISTNISNIIFT